MSKIRMLESVAVAVLLLAAGPLVAQVPAPGPQPPVDMELVQLTPEEMAWGEGPASLPAGARAVVLVGDPAAAGPFALRVAVPDGYLIPPHRHPAIENVTIVSGTFIFGLGEEMNAAVERRFPAGSFVAIPPGTVHYARTEGETVVQLHGIGPWDIHYVNPADDPRRP